MEQDVLSGDTIADSGRSPQRRHLAWPEDLDHVALSGGGAGGAAACPSYKALARRFAGTAAEQFAYTLVWIAGTEPTRRARRRYHSTYEFLLREGQHYELKDRPSSLDAGIPGRCYANCYKVAMRAPERYAYCEGMAEADGIPFEHAWLLDLQDGRIVDPTWLDDTAGAYIGVAVARSYLATAFRRSGRVFLEQGSRNPILTGEAGETWRHGQHSHASC
ncbi:hypothetical protein [Muricoccus vinaceus]|uniref:Uncharacterized protein n=1 Tax=Muricoccus vinaceus TaxID=424704 RepID=A0ABV6INF1_9PROT